MKDRLLKFLTAINLSPSRFAEELGIQPSGVSHILSGRNNPSYDFIVKILSKFPDLNPEWLLLGKGDMMRTVLKQANLFDNYNNENITNLNVTNVKSEEPSMYKGRSGIKDKSKSEEKIHGPERIVMFFADGSFKDYTPE